MKFISTNGESEPATFQEAILRGLAPDGGLYVPAEFPSIDSTFINDLSQKTLPDIAFEITRYFVDEIKPEYLRELLNEAINFDAPLVPLHGNRYILELFHGPTMAFKDFGARFMSRLFGALQGGNHEEIVILAATSGDTGSAVAQGFLGVEGIKVCLLYPSGKVSKLQEQQITTAGHNVTALEINGTFDDCQQMVKEAFSDPELDEKLILSSANSINIARLIPQTFYYFYALSQLGEYSEPIFSVPSGNFGNLTAGLWAKKMGMPAKGFIAATNANDIFPEYLNTGEFNPKPSVQTISNAMDVGNPSNFDRIEHLFDYSHEKIKSHIWGASFSDDQTRKAIRKVYDETGYILDPHTAVGYLGVEEYINSDEFRFGNNHSPFVILATAHPAKFSEEIEPVIHKEIKRPERLRKSMEKEKQSIELPNDYRSLKQFLQESYI